MGTTGGAGDVRHWPEGRVHELVELVAQAAPVEDLRADELLTACFERPGVVLEADGGTGGVAVGVGRDHDGEVVGEVRLLVVHPAHRRRGTGAALLAAAEAWAREQGAVRLVLGGVLPFALWPGAEPGSGAGELALARGYRMAAEGRTVAVPPSFRAAPPEGVSVRRAVRDDDVAAALAAVAARWPRWSDEVARALDHGTCHLALAAGGAGPSEDAVVGVACHSVTRATWVGPLVVDEAHRRRGIGHALLGQVCRDLMIAELGPAVAPGDDGAEAEAFLLAAGGVPDRSWRRFVRQLGS